VRKAAGRDPAREIELARELERSPQQERDAAGNYEAADPLYPELRTMFEDTGRPPPRMGRAASRTSIGGNRFTTGGTRQPKIPVTR